MKKLWRFFAVFCFAAVLVAGVVPSFAFCNTKTRAQQASGKSVSAPASAEVSNSVVVPIIMYHSVCKTNVNAYVLSPDDFERDIKYLQAEGYNTVTVSALARYVRGEQALPEKPIVLTFDDGFYNNLYYVLPLLEKYDCVATVCVVGAFSQKEENERKRSPVYSYLSSKEIAELASSGRVEIGNHTFDMHSAGARRGVLRRSGESQCAYTQTLTDDATRCGEYIRSVTGKTPTTFAYPYGYHDTLSDDIICDLGYDALLTCAEQVNRLRVGDTKALRALGRFNRPSGISSARFFGKFKTSEA